jgi:hypothetical protein
MAKLPHCEEARVEQRKIVDYLLSGSHPGGRAKAGFFRRFGFRVEDWRALERALRHHAQSAEILSRIETPFGTKYTLEGPFPAADGRVPWVRTVWFVAAGDSVPRLVTAFPAAGERA